MRKATPFMERTQRSLVATAATAMLLLSMVLTGAPARAVDDPLTYKGTLPGTVIEYVFEVPANWNGTLFLYSHGISYGPLYAAVSGDQFTRNWLLAQGYALAGGSYGVNGYDPVAQYPGQIAVLDAFDGITGRHPSRVIAWGHSGGGQIVADLVQFAPDRFAGAVAMCPLDLAGSIGRFNLQLNHVFVLKTLLGLSRPIVNMGFGFGQLTAFTNEELAIMRDAQTTPAGRARFALAEAMVDRPDWSGDALEPRPASTDYATRANNEFAWALNDWFADQSRGRYEARIAKAIGTYNYNTGEYSGANFSWNTDVSYADMLARSDSADLVAALYAQAGLSLADEVARLDAAPKIAADSGAIVRMEALLPIFDRVNIPVATLYGVGDPYVNISESQGYDQLASDSGTTANLRQLYLPIGGHCEFTYAEQLTTIQTLITRLDSGVWPSTAAATLNAQASAMGPSANRHVGSRPQDPRFASYAPPPFRRNFNGTTVNPYP